MVTGLLAFRPAYVEDIERWSKIERRSSDEGWARFAHFFALRCLSSDPTLNNCLVVHGSAAMCYVHGVPRTPKDIDLMISTGSVGSNSVSMSESDFADCVSRLLSNEIEHVYPEVKPYLARLEGLIKIDLFAKAKFTTDVVIPLARTNLQIRVADIMSCSARKYFKILKRSRRKPWLIARDLFDFAWLLGRYKIDAEKMLSHFREDFASFTWPPYGEHQALFNDAMEGAGSFYADALALTFGEPISYQVARRAVTAFHADLLDQIGAF